MIEKNKKVIALIDSVEKIDRELLIINNSINNDKNKESKLKSSEVDFRKQTSSDYRNLIAWSIVINVGILFFNGLNGDSYALVTIVLVFLVFLLLVIKIDMRATKQYTSHELYKILEESDALIKKRDELYSMRDSLFENAGLPRKYDNSDSFKLLKELFVSRPNEPVYVFYPLLDKNMERLAIYRENQRKIAEEESKIALKEWERQQFIEKMELRKEEREYERERRVESESESENKYSSGFFSSFFDQSDYEYDCCEDDFNDNGSELVNRKEYVYDKFGNKFKTGSSGKRVQDSAGNWYELDFEDGDAYIRSNDYFGDEGRLRSR